MITRWFHGLAAYRGTRHPFQQVRAAEKCLEPGAEIAVADRPIGPIGVVLSGPLAWVADSDVWSEIADDGTRVCGNGSRLFDGDLDDPAAVEEWVAAVHARRTDDGWSDGEYCEAAMDARMVCAIWIKPYVGERERKVARILARRYGVSIIEVERHTRIWEIMPTTLPTASERAYERYARMARAAGYDD